MIYSATLKAIPNETTRICTHIHTHTHTHTCTAARTHTQAQNYFGFVCLFVCFFRGYCISLYVGSRGDQNMIFNWQKHIRNPSVNCLHSNQHKQLSRNTRKCTFRYVHPAKIQISLNIQAVWSLFSGCILDSQECKVSSCGHWGFRSDYEDAQADFSLHCMHMSDSIFFLVVAQFFRQTLEYLGVWIVRNSTVLYKIVTTDQTTDTHFQHQQDPKKAKKMLIFFLFLHKKHMLLVPIRSPSPRYFKWLPITCFCGERRKILWISLLIWSYGVWHGVLWEATMYNEI